MRLLAVKTDRLDAEALRETIMQQAAVKDLDSAVVVEALAQVLALIAARAETQNLGQPMMLAERMATLHDRVDELYRHWLTRMRAIPVVGSGKN